VIIWGCDGADTTRTLFAESVAILPLMLLPLFEGGGILPTLRDSPSTDALADRRTREEGADAGDGV
jgi:hypothetical protein